jgi:hypothetical protein
LARACRCCRCVKWRELMLLAGCDAAAVTKRIRTVIPLCMGSYGELCSGEETGAVGLLMLPSLYGLDLFVRNQIVTFIRMGSLQTTEPSSLRSEATHPDRSSRQRSPFTSGPCSMAP